MHQLDRHQARLIDRRRSLGCLAPGRNHRLEEWQGDGRPQTTNEGAAGNVSAGDEFHESAFALRESGEAVLFESTGPARAAQVASIDSPARFRRPESGRKRD